MQSIQQQFLTWCRSKPADEEFDYTYSNACAFYQFAKAHGIPKPDRSGFEIPDTMREAILGAVDLHGVGTFGALADRLEAALS